MGYTVDSEVDAQIESLRSLQAGADVDRFRMSTRSQTLCSPQTWSTPRWARIIQPIMLRADSM
jgi:hypothetical protein